MSPDRGRFPASARYLRALVAAVIGIAVAVVGVATPSTAAPTTGPAGVSTGKDLPTVPGCAAVKTPTMARCFSLIRTGMRPQHVTPQDTPAGYGPSDLQSAYNLPSATAGSDQVVGIVDAFDDPNAEADLAVYRSQYGLPPCTSDTGCFSKVNQDGDAGPYPPVDAGWATEISLDLDMVSAACPNCKIVLVEATDNSIDNLAASVDTAISLGANYVSNSYGAGEDPSETDYDAFYNHPGVVVTASTGDDGYGTSYPATAPGVTAVGGTSLVSDSSARGWTETAWDGAGSGCSDVEPKPDFQTDAGCDGRSIADVSAVADPSTGVAVYDSTPYQGVGWQVYGGTSASSPLIASTYALAGQPAAGTDTEGYPYDKTDQLNDVTSGSNGSCDPAYLCTAGPGYDGPTGLGTPNGVAAFSAGPHGVIEGTVTDSATSDPIAGAKVSSEEGTATTDADGGYTMTVPVGTYTVTAAAYGYKSASQDDVAVADGATVDEDFALDPVPTVTLSGTVTDGSGHGWPLYSEITIDGVPGGPVYTNPFTGHYSIDLPSQNTYSMTVEPVYPGYTTDTESVTLGTQSQTQNIQVGVDASACDAPGYEFKYAGAIQHFDADTIPSDWTVTDNNGGGSVWVANDPGGRGNLTGGTGNFAMIDSDDAGTSVSQDTDLVSPVVDLSDNSAPEIALNTDYRPFLDTSTADIDYTIDGGTTWTNVWEGTTDRTTGALEIPLPDAANQPAVQVRFHYTGSFSYWWEVDDVLIGTKSCGTDPGGLVAGFTRDGNTRAPIVGATVTSTDVPADQGVSAATPDDAAQPDGFYWLYSSVTGTHTFTASKSHYTSRTKNVTVQADYVTREDFVLGAGQVAAAPGEVTATVTLGRSASRSFTLANTGTAPAHVTLGEQDGGFQIAGRPAEVAYRDMRGAKVQHVSGHFSPLRLSAGKARQNATAKRTATRPADAPWAAIADLPTALSSNAAVFGDGTLYSVGGYNGQTDTPSLYAYDPSTLAWTQRADMPQTREAPNAAYVDGKLYVLGGWGPDGSPVAETDVYDPGSNAWTAVADNPKPYAGSGTAVVGSKIYLVGGCSSSCGVSDVEVYDTATDTWSSAPDYPTTTSWIACGGIDGVLYCAGGTNDSGSATATYAFDGTSWSPRADLPADDWGAAYSAANGQLLVSGGAINGSTALTNQGWAYDPASDTWSTLPNSNNAYYRLGGACGFYKVGGSVDGNGTPSADAEVLPGYDSCTAATDVPWLSEDASGLDLAPGRSATVTVTMDSAELTQPGTYQAEIIVGTDTPYRVDPIQVTFTVKPPKTWGRISGVVSGMPCTGSAAPIAGATVEIDSWAASYTLTTDKDGAYVLWLDRRNNPLTMIVAKDGWKPQTTTARVRPGYPLVKNFTLKPGRAC